MPLCPACQQPSAGAGPCDRCVAAGRHAARGAEVRLSRADAWAAVIGPRHTERYLRRFVALGAPGASRVGWHWPAFFAPPLWFLYRKMWRWAVLWVLGIPLVLAADGLVAGASGPFRITLDGAAALILLMGGFVLPALFAESLYRDHCDHVIRRTARKGPRTRHLSRLAARGGTSDVAATAAAMFCGVAVLAIVAGLAVAVWVDYGKREKIVEALRVGARARAAVAAFVDRRGALPATWQDARFEVPPLPAHVGRLVLDPRTGSIDIETRLSEAEFGSIRLLPETDGAEHIVWRCRADPVLEPFSPRSCRGTD